MAYITFTYTYTYILFNIKAILQKMLNAESQFGSISYISAGVDLVGLVGRILTPVLGTLLPWLQGYVNNLHFEQKQAIDREKERGQIWGRQRRII